MKLKAFAVRDQLVGSFMRPFFLQTEGVAIRTFSDEVNRVDESNQMNKHPQDFALWYIGDFDEDSGKLSGVEPRQLIVASECVKKGE